LYLSLKVVITMKPAGTEYTDSQADRPGRSNEMEKTSGKRKNTLIFACSGLSNTGKLTMQAASALAFRRPDLYRASAAHKGIEAVEDALSEGFKILALDGCTDRCATKKLDEAGLKADVYLMVTELGVEKTRPSDLKPEYIEKIIRAIKDA
jgi:uncharacterized metal-binding protein